MARAEISIEQIAAKIHTLSSEDLAELHSYIEFLHFKRYNMPAAEAGNGMRRIHLRGILAGHDIEPEMLAEVQRDLWRESEQDQAQIG